MDTTQERVYVIELKHADGGWEELYRSASEAEARRCWAGLPHTGITARARFLEVTAERTFDPSTARA